MDEPTPNAWLYVRAHESIRVVLDGKSLLVFGPGPRFSAARFTDQMGAMMRHATLQRELMSDGWSQEPLGHDRRSGAERRSKTRGTDRRQILRLVSDRDAEDETS